MTGRINKLDAAERQLVAAVRMFFGGGDPVPVYTLAAASREILSTILEKSKQTSSLDLISKATGRGRREVIAALHGRARFFKHADTDPECVLTDFDEGEVDAVLFAASHDFQELAGGGPMEAQAFELWFWAIHEAHPDSESEIVRAVRRTFPDIKLLSREEQRRVGRELLEWASKRPGAAGSYARVVSLDAMRSR